MSAIELVVVMLIAIGAAIAAVLITVWISSLVQGHRMRVEPLLADVRQAIVAALSGDQSRLDEAFMKLSRFSERYIASVMLDLAPSVTGTSKAVMVSLGERVGMLERARAGLSGRRWATRSYSARVLTAFGVESDEMCNLLVDRSPEVRAQAAAWSVVTPNPAAIKLLLALINDSDGLCRFAAQDALIRIGLSCSDMLISALELEDEETSDRLLEIAAAMGDERFFEAAASLIHSQSTKTRSLASSVLARTGNPRAAALLISLLEDPSNEVVLSAAAGLAKMSYWPGAADIEPLLRSESWDLRKQAALTLLAFGAPGAIFLRVTAPGEGPAAEMAVHALQLQALASQLEAA